MRPRRLSIATYDQCVDRDDLSDLATPDCPEWLEPMSPVVMAWWREGFRVGQGLVYAMPEP